MDLKAAIDRVAQLGAQADAEATRVQIVEWDGRSYENQRGTLSLMSPPRAAPLKTTTLQAVVDYLRGPGGVEAVDPVVLIGPGEVRVVTHLLNPERRREELLVASAITPAHPFGTPLEQEAAVVWLQQCFERTPELEELLWLIGNLRGGTITTLVDDGITQQVTVAAGVQRAGTAEAPPLLHLRPYRTFSEVLQPESAFVLRLVGGDSIPKVIIYETGDVLWRSRAAASIEEHIRTLLGAEGEGVVYLR